MSKVKILSSNATNEVEIEKPFAGLAVKLKVLKADLGTDDLAVNPVTMQTSIFAFLGAQMMSLTYTDKSGKPLYLYNNVPLSVLSEFFQNEEGIIKVSHFDATHDNVDLYIPLNANGGAISFNNDETLEIKLITSADVVSGTINTIESPILSPDWFKVNKLYVEQGQTEKAFTIDDYETIMIPLSAMTEDCVCTIQYTNGSVCRFVKEELEAIGQTTNDVVINIHGLTSCGFGKHAILNIAEARSIEFHRTETDSFELHAVNNLIVNNLKEVRNSNQGFISTTDAKTFIEMDKKLS